MKCVWSHFCSHEKIVNFINNSLSVCYHLVCSKSSYLICVIQKRGNFVVDKSLTRFQSWHVRCGTLSIMYIGSQLICSHYTSISKCLELCRARCFDTLHCY